jgi:hypothetical protein
MTDKTARLVLNIDAGAEADVEELEWLTRNLQKELAELDVATVDLVCAGKAPERAKAGDPISWGTLLITLAASSGVLTMLIKTLQSLLTRNERYSVTLKIGEDKLVLKGITSSERQRLVDAWINRHAEKENIDD